MSVFTYPHITHMVDAVQGMADSFHKRMKFTLTNEEFLQAFVRDEHVRILEEADEICGLDRSKYVHTKLYHPGQTAGDAEEYTMVCMLEFAVNAPVVPPKYVSLGMKSVDVPESLLEKISQWRSDRMRTGRAFGIVAEMLSQLNETCGDARAMATILPCLPTIMDATKDKVPALEKRAKKLTSATGIGAMPRMSMEQRQVIADAAAVATAAALMGEAPDTRPPVDGATLTCHRIHMGPNIFNSPVKYY